MARPYQNSPLLLCPLKAPTTTRTQNMKKMPSSLKLPQQSERYSHERYGKLSHFWSTTSSSRPETSTTRKDKSKQYQAKPPTPPEPKVTGKLAPTLNEQSSTAPIENSSGTSPMPPQLVKFDPKSFKSRSRSPGPPSSRFQPLLPELPSPRPSGMGVRKRKASHDLIMNSFNKESKLEGTPRIGPTPGKDLEHPDPLIDVGAEHAKKKQNVVTRTIWTLIMIFGFLGQITSATSAILIPNSHNVRSIGYGSSLGYRTCVFLPRPCIPGSHHFIFNDTSEACWRQRSARV